MASQDNFFDIGGCSLTALDVLDRITTATGLKLGLREFLHEPTVQALAAQLATARRETHFAGQCRRPSPSPPRQFLPHSDGAPLDMATIPGRRPPPNFSVFFFSGEAPQEASEDIYHLVTEAAKIADAEGFEALWVPERHFHRFGGLFPAPAVLGAALATITERLSIRAGSVVLPLHNPIDVVEQWAVVDNLSGGRVGVSVAPGFHPTDFSLCPEKFPDRRASFWDSVTKLQALWAGELFDGKDGLNRDVQLVVLPRPYQKQLPLWITASESEQSFREAGVRGANVLTALLALDVATLEKRIKVYRDARTEYGALTGGKVTAMLHAYVDPDPAKVEAIGVLCLKRYLETHLDFASGRPEYAKVTALTNSDRQAIVDHAAQRYVKEGSLVGTPAQCAAFARKLVSIGVDEIACLVDFGIPHKDAIASLKQIAFVRAQVRSNEQVS